MSFVINILEIIAVIGLVYAALQVANVVPIVGIVIGILIAIVIWALYSNNKKTVSTNG